MRQIVEIDERGSIQLPADLLATVKPHTRFALERRGTTRILPPLAAAPFWVKATPAERAAAITAISDSSFPLLPNPAGMVLQCLIAPPITRVRY
jgi:hypothetical protein